MGLGLFVISSWSLVLLAVSLFISLNATNFYFFTLPFILTTGLVVALAVLTSLLDRLRVGLYRTALFLHGLLIFPFYYALNRWPGGDDGPGLAWLLFIGTGSCIGLVLTIVFAAKGAARSEA